MVDINDPVSDFLSREQSALAELNENFNLNDECIKIFLFFIKINNICFNIYLIN